MVSVGTVFTLGIIGAAAVGGYALFRNADKIGGAFSRGVEKSVTVPFGNYVDNLWKDVSDSVVDTTKVTVTKAVAEPFKNIPNPFNVFTNPFPPAYGESGKTQPKLPPPQKKLTPTPGAPTLVPPGASTIPQLLEMVKSKAGYYYQNFAPGGRQDRQIKLKAGTADKLKKRGYDLTFLTPSKKLSPTAFTLFGKSKGYL